MPKCVAIKDWAFIALPISPLETGVAPPNVQASRNTIKQINKKLLGLYRSTSLPLLLRAHTRRVSCVCATSFVAGAAASKCTAFFGTSVCEGFSTSTCGCVYTVAFSERKLPRAAFAACVGAICTTADASVS